MKEIWRIMKFKDCPSLDGIYKISNTGRVISIGYSVAKKDKNGNKYMATRKDRELVFRCSKKSPLLFTTICKKLWFGESIQKTFYIHKQVAIHFLKNPNTTRYKKVAHIKFNEPQNNNVDNLKWVDDKFLVKRNLKEYPNLKNTLRDNNINSGYYKKKGGRNAAKVSDRKSIVYYELRNNRIVNNNTGKTAKLDVVSLANILEKFNHKIKSFMHFKFERLTTFEQAEIKDMLPTNILNIKQKTSYKQRHSNG